MNAALIREAMVDAFDIHRQQMLRVFASLARAHPDVAREEADATRCALEQILAIEDHTDV